MVQAQSWAPIGAKWTYKQGSWSGPDTNLAVIEAYGDTVLAGRTYSKLGVQGGGFFCHSFLPYFTANADSVWYWDPLQEMERLLFRWNALPGDSWSTPLSADIGLLDTLDWTVLDTAYLVVGGLHLRQLWMNVDSRQGYVFGINYGEVTERLGGSTAPFTWVMAGCDAETFNQLRCYEDDEIQWQNPAVPSCALGPPEVTRFDIGYASWSVADTYPQGSAEHPNFVGTSTLRYFFNGDTLLDGDTWQRMFSQPLPGDPSDAVLEGLVRQDGDVVRLANEMGGVDTLYNFALNIGDSVRYSLPDQNETYLTIIAVDSILIQSAYHRVFQFDISEEWLTPESWFTDTWIEGIGSIHGPLAPRKPETLGYNNAFPDSTRTTCYRQGGTVLWQHPGYTTCVVNIGVGVDEQENNVFTVHPNPATDVIHVNGLPPGTWSYYIVDALGRIETTGVIKAEGVRRIDLHTLLPGWHVLHFDDLPGINLRIIKE